jgi:hypothetical protein
MSDILDLLSDNSTVPKNTSTKNNKGFLNVLKKTSIVDTGFSKPTFDKIV